MSMCSQEHLGKHGKDRPRLSFQQKACLEVSVPSFLNVIGGLPDTQFGEEHLWVQNQVCSLRNMLQVLCSRCFTQSLGCVPNRKGIIPAVIGLMDKLTDSLRYQFQVLICRTGQDLKSTELSQHDGTSRIFITTHLNQNRKTQKIPNKNTLGYAYKVYMKHRFCLDLSLIIYTQTRYCKSLSLFCLTLQRRLSPEQTRHTVSAIGIFRMLCLFKIGTQRGVTAILMPSYVSLVLLSVLATVL